MSNILDIKFKPLPKALQPAIRRAKLAIQELLLDDECAVKRAIALREIKNADAISEKNGKRRRWRHELLIVPHYILFPDSWYCESHITVTDPVWDIDTMPLWAYFGRIEPYAGEIINEKKYTPAPKS